MLKIQKMLHICNDHLDSEKENDQHQAFAVLGIALIAMGEDIGAEMALRTFNHLVSKQKRSEGLRIAWDLQSMRIYRCTMVNR